MPALTFSRSHDGPSSNDPMTSVTAGQTSEVTSGPPTANDTQPSMTEWDGRDVGRSTEALMFCRLNRNGGVPECTKASRDGADPALSRSIIDKNHGISGPPETFHVPSARRRAVQANRPFQRPARGKEADMKSARWTAALIAALVLVLSAGCMSSGVALRRDRA